MFEVLDLLLTCLNEGQNGDLVRRFKQRDPEALSEIYDRYGRIVYLLIFRIVHDSGIAEDIQQETFLRAWNRAAQFDETHPTIGPWLLTIARHCVLDYLKSSAVRHTSRKAIEDVQTPSITMDKEILDADQARVLRVAFRSLTPNQRKVIELAYYEGLSHQQIALRLQAPLGTVKGWTRAALLRLRHALDEGAAGGPFSEESGELNGPIHANSPDLRRAKS